MNQFKLIVNGSSVRNLNENTLKEAVYNLNKEDGSFIILEPKQPINNSIYLQGIYEGGKFVAEIRFIFDSDTDYKHYSCVVDNTEKLYSLFSNYYLKKKTPDIQHWKNESAISDNEQEDEMVKLYKKIKNTTHYFEVWLNDDEKSLTIHKGVVGDIGETEDVIYDEDGDLPVKIGMAQIVSDIKKNGYTDTVLLTEIIIQYTYEEKADITPFVKKAQDVESLLNECLGWTGNGHCEGNDIDSGTINLFCYVVEKAIASKTILEMLVEEGYFHGVKISYADSETEEYKLLYPLS